MMNQPERLRMGDLLGNRIPFRIPVYQRGYAWERDELEDFMADVGSLDADHEASHFFGGILSVQKAAPETLTGHFFELVDGQQRITTFTLLLNAIVNGLGAAAAEAQAEGDEQSTER